MSSQAAPAAAREQGGPSRRELPRRVKGFLLPPELGPVRLVFFLSLIALALIRLLLSQPTPPLAVPLLGTWIVVVGVFYLAPPRAGRLVVLAHFLRFSLFIFETAALLLVMYAIGGSGLLAILFLLYLTVELNLLYPGSGGLAGSTLAAVACIAVVAAEATGRLLHDPFYSVGHPLYREPAYMVAIAIISLSVLVALPTQLGRLVRRLQRQASSGSGSAGESNG